MRSLLLVAVAVCALIALGAAHNKEKAWIRRANGSMRVNHTVEIEDGSNSWIRRDGITRCGTCNSRCYTTEFNLTAETSGAPAGLCSTLGDNCRITIYVKTAPCSACAGGTQETTVIEQNDGTTFTLTSTESRCEVSRMLVLVNGYRTLPLENTCDPEAAPLFQQQWVDGDATSNNIKDCAAHAQAGSRLTQAYKGAYRNGRYPDPCFADEHLVDTLVTQQQGVLTTNFRMWRPNSNAIWFDGVLEHHQSLHQISCHKMPKDIDCQLYA